MGTFAIDVAKWVEQTNSDIDEAVRAIAIAVTTKIVLKSPVGNPELWAANAHAAYGRQTHNLFVEQINATLQAGQKPTRRVGQKKLKTLYPLKTGKNYVGGRFRANWQLTIGSPAAGEVDGVDPSGAKTISASVEALNGFTAGPTIYITNNLPYGHRLEYEAWSKQAPAGMVRVTVAEYNNIASAAVSAIK